MLYYVPLESYRERYTMQWAAPITGWLERNWIKHGIAYKRVGSPYTEDQMNVGYILDAERRAGHCFFQIQCLINKAVKGEIKNDDIIYFDDFWHPGIEALPYTFHLLGIKPKMYAFCHAQSVDEFDFTHPMRHWMRDFEKGIGKILDGIFVNCTVLRDLLERAEIGIGKVHVIGHIFDEEEVDERMPKAEGDGLRSVYERKNHVLFTSRWDTEKNPQFFLKVAETIIKYRSDIIFIVCTSAKELKSNNPALIKLLHQKMVEFPDNIFLKEGLLKEDYYRLLCKAKIQLNTADQDFVSIALLEASVAGCYPLYPKFRSFPEAFRHMQSFMYKHKDSDECAREIKWILIQSRNWSPEVIEDRAWIHRRHNMSWARMINIMFGEKKIEVEDYG